MAVEGIVGVTFCVSLVALSQPPFGSLASPSLSEKVTVDETGGISTAIGHQQNVIDANVCNLAGKDVVGAEAVIAQIVSALWSVCVQPDAL